jgi:hypothetical protein
MGRQIVAGFERVLLPGLDQLPAFVLFRDKSGKLLKSFFAPVPAPLSH